MNKKELAPKHLAHAWVIWILSALFMFYKYALEVSPSVMTNILMSTYQIDAAQLGSLAASYFYAYLIMQIPAGIFLDRFGPRKITTLAIIACSIGVFIFSRSQTLFFASVGRFITGAGASFAAVNCLKLVANWFPKRRFAFMAGLMMSVGMLGAVGGQAPLSAFIKDFFWRDALEIIAVVGLIFSAVFFIVVRNSAPGKKEANITSTKITLFKSLAEIFKNPQSWYLSIYSGFAFAPVMVFGGLWGVSFIEEAYEISKAFASQYLSLIFIGFAVGAPVFGWLSDWLQNRKKVMFWGTLTSSLCLTMVIYFPHASYYFLTLLLFLFGFTISSFLLCFTMIREINPLILSATAIGFMNSFDALFGSFSDPLTGKILDLYWDGKLVEGARIFSVATYQKALLFLPIYLLISLIFLLFIKETNCKDINTNFLS